MKIAAIVILYNPDKLALENIQSYYAHVDKVYVFDNSEKDWGVKESLQQFSKIELYQNFENRGIAERLNDGCRKAINDGFEWLLTMDQDTTFTDKTITDYFYCADNFEQKNRIAMFGTDNDRKEAKSSRECETKEMEELITSGSLLNLALVEQLGMFDENLFIDYVDNDYCYRAKHAGFLLIQFKNIVIIHHLGNMVFKASLKSLYIWKKKKMVHPPLRCYYLYRNMLYLETKYKNIDPELAATIRHDITNHVNKSILYGRQELKSLAYVKKAKRDFKNGKMGKIDKLL